MKYAIDWTMLGGAEVEADSPEEAQRIAANELMRWNGHGLCTDITCPGASTVETETLGPAEDWR